MKCPHCGKEISAGKLVQKFEIWQPLGKLEVPVGYVHATALASFYKKHQEKKKPSFYYYNDNINDANFSKPSCIVKPGDKFQVDVCRQIVGDSTSSEERMDFLASHKGVHLGAQGASLVFDHEEMRRQLPRGYWYLSFDEKDRLWQDANRYHRVPNVHAHTYGDFKFSLGLFEKPWYDDNCFLLFRDFIAA